MLKYRARVITFLPVFPWRVTNVVSPLICNVCVTVHACWPTLGQGTPHMGAIPYTELCKSNANDNRWISHFVLTIYRRYISETSHGLPNIKTINHRDIGIIFAISCRGIILARLPSNDISQSKTIYHHDISLLRSSLSRHVVVNCASIIYRNEAIVYDESVFVYT